MATRITSTWADTKAAQFTHLLGTSDPHNTHHDCWNTLFSRLQLTQWPVNWVTRGGILPHSIMATFFVEYCTRSKSWSDHRLVKTVGTQCVVCGDTTVKIACGFLIRAISFQQRQKTLHFLNKSCRISFPRKQLSNCHYFLQLICLLRSCSGAFTITITLSLHEACVEISRSYKRSCWWMLIYWNCWKVINCLQSRLGCILFIADTVINCMSTYQESILCHSQCSTYYSCLGMYLK